MIENKKFKSGEVICHEGEFEHFMYDLIDGSVEVVRDYDMPTQRKIASIEQGFFGEMGMLRDFPRTATIVAASNCEVNCIDSKSLDEYLSNYPEKSLDLLKMLAQRLRETDEKYLSACQVISDYLNTDGDKSGIVSRMHEYKDILVQRG